MPQQKISRGELNTHTNQLRESLADLHEVLNEIAQLNPESFHVRQMQDHLCRVYESSNSLLRLAHQAV
jgi:hypothetical protein